MLRRVLLTLSLVLTSSVTFADLIDNNSIDANDRLGSLSRTLSTGGFSTATSTSDDASIVLNNQSLANKYGTQTTSTGLGAWLSAHPIEDARLTSSYGMRSLLGTTRAHKGIDLAAPTGTAIYATGPGVVTHSGWGRGWGNYVEVDHGNGYVTRYAHASRINVALGEYVSAGQHIANVGCTGRCTGPHLHFEILKAGKSQNPSTYLALLP